MRKSCEIMVNKLAGILLSLASRKRPTAAFQISMYQHFKSVVACCGILIDIYQLKPFLQKILQKKASCLCWVCVAEQDQQKFSFLCLCQSLPWHLKVSCIFNHQEDSTL
ncbi:uncharacterized protein MELLADRAFT_87323 [Melampsora larici-populina 98AG31]|uniref:Uncharacterized protein n=1 Tax=Melampsora larici-populina (strain 98AG31 / pathotype 3-4-7) TaxID=747676 RepID=F4RMU4_MELLP|nr:uncharacterized protein MELLADRAFT_87323 [Melampsora larici-populina 98AG31]EGG06171.1 hypothetical protein MELLADRAFT_87323 [Melampsora larici-populina 98AG31]